MPLNATDDAKAETTHLLDQIKAKALGMLQCVIELHDAKLLPGGTDDHAHLTRANAVVDSNLLELDGFG